jgi:DNA-binding LytR/AlgR family response regulator
MKLNCVIVDDEPLASQGLAKYIEEIDYLNLIAIAENPLELNKILDTQSIDLIFLDIQMPHMTGIDFLRKNANLPMVIITTAFPNYALEGFNFDVVDYLLKPITFNRFIKSTDKANELHSLKNKSHNSLEEPHLFIKCEYKYEKILTKEILFIQALQNYVMIHTTSKKYMTMIPLKKVEEYLDSREFKKVHKSYLVAISKVETITPNELTINETQIPISRNLKDEVMELVLKNKLMGKG